MAVRKQNTARGASRAWGDPSRRRVFGVLLENVRVSGESLLGIRLAVTSGDYGARHWGITGLAADPSSGLALRPGSTARRDSPTVSE